MTKLEPITKWEVCFETLCSIRRHTDDERTLAYMTSQLRHTTILHAAQHIIDDDNSYC